MIVSIGTKIKDGPWGGGNLFAINLRNYLEKKGHRVINNLDELLYLDTFRNMRLF